MKCIALTGIAPEVIRELKLGKARTLELQSTHNVVSLTGVNPGESVFMTSIDREDLSPGDAGIIVELQAVSITMKRIIEYTQGLHFEERERVAARLKVKLLCSSSVKSVASEGLAQPTTVDAMKCSCFQAG
jgi:hypothetical protein